MTVTTLHAQLEWVEKCLKAMQLKGSASGDVLLQQCVVDTIKARIIDKYGHAGLSVQNHAEQ
jgi:hypothetical protein